MIARDWYRSFFGDAYVGILRAQKGAEKTREEVAFIVRALGLRDGARILDVACGFGRHARLLARMGFAVVGVDLSAAMIAEARRRGESARLRFVRADMRALPYEAEFDAVVNMFTSFGYFTQRENRLALRRMARALRPGGRILIDHRDPLFDAGRPTRGWFALPGGSYVLEQGRFDRRRGVAESSWLILRPGDRRPRRIAFRCHEYTLPRWRAMFRRAGLLLTAAYSGYGRPYRRGAGRLVVVGRRV